MATRTWVPGVAALAGALVGGCRSGSQAPDGGPITGQPGRLTQVADDVPATAEREVASRWDAAVTAETLSGTVAYREAVAGAEVCTATLRLQSGGAPAAQVVRGATFAHRVDSVVEAQTGACVFPWAEAAAGQSPTEDSYLAAYFDWTDDWGSTWSALLVSGSYGDAGSQSGAVWGERDGSVTGDGTWSPATGALEWSVGVAIETRAFGAACAAPDAQLSDGAPVAGGGVRGAVGCTRGVPRADLYSLRVDAGDWVQAALTPDVGGPALRLELLDTNGCVRGADHSGPGCPEGGGDCAGLAWMADAGGEVQVAVWGDCDAPDASYTLAVRAD